MSSLLSSGKLTREKEGFPRPCLEGVVLREGAELLAAVTLPEGHTGGSELHQPAPGAWQSYSRQPGAAPTQAGPPAPFTWEQRPQLWALSPGKGAGGLPHLAPRLSRPLAPRDTGVRYLVRSEAALLLLLLLDSESELLRGRLQSLRYTRKLFFTGWFPLLKPLAGRSGEKNGPGGRYEGTAPCGSLPPGPWVPCSPMGASSVDLSLSLSELELGRGLRPRFLCRWEEPIMGSCGGPMGLLPWPGAIWLSRFFGGRPGRLGGPAVFGFFLEKSTEVLLPTSCAGVEEELGPRPAGGRRRH